MIDPISSPSSHLCSSPTLILETSWEVCHKVGGIYTVLSTRAATMTRLYGQDQVLFVGPWLHGVESSDFVRLSDPASLQVADHLRAHTGLQVRYGRWRVPGAPLCILVDFAPLYEQTGALYYEMWEHYGIRGDIGYGDYDESCHFAIAAAMVMMAYSALRGSTRPIAIFNEWTTGLGLLYTRLHCPSLPTLFITHATTVGRSIAGNGKELYRYMTYYQGDVMADELHVMCKHQVEKAAAHHASAFGTVSEVTDIECRQLLDRPADHVLYNGFEYDFVPGGERYSQLRQQGRHRVLEIARTLYGTSLPDDALIIGTSGRCEYRNKGLDLYIEALRRLVHHPDLHTPVVALVTVPSWVGSARRDLQYGLSSGDTFTMPMHQPYVTHEVLDGLANPILRHLHDLEQEWGRSVYPIFVPSYLDGHDGILDIAYYDLLPALDFAAFASYYEPWGYTPLESMAFGIPTLTTDKAGYGLWAMQMVRGSGIKEGIVVCHRDDDDQEPTVQSITESVIAIGQMSAAERYAAARAAQHIAAQAEWSLFFPQYQQAFETAMLHCIGDTMK